ncbi:efflux RND transporter periplasmic adaptor subunit [Thorsellia kenyensis]|uniref:Efflux RND transporter periplasmic adaptor subunit n=1 Tax=Thorsellia kenyensis TaxID=1549888 RepID=A0ABV6CC12_9GAMM
MRGHSNFKQLKKIVFFSSVIGGSLLLAGCNGATWCNIKASLGFGSKAICQQQENQAKGPEVGVYTLKAQSFTLQSNLPGRVLAYRTAEIRPQVSGVLLKKHFEEGADVKAGTSLYQIDPAPFEAAVRSAEGNLAAAKASAEIASITVSRFQSLLANKSVSRQDFDSALATKRQADAAVKQAEGALDNAKINLDYTKVLAPIDGRVGRSHFTEGALVSSSQTQALATINQLDSVYIDIPQSSRDYQYLRNKIAAGELKVADVVKVSLKLENGDIYSHTGEVSFSDINVNPSTGAVVLRAIFPNPNQTLLPGMFVSTVIDEGVIENAVLIPQQAVSRTPSGDATTIVVTKENTIEPRVLKIDRAEGNMWLVAEGVKAGERVLVSGLANLRFLNKDNPTVTAIEEDPNAPPTQAKSEEKPKES